MRPQQASPNDLPLLNWPHGLVSWYKICDILDQVGSVRFNWLKPLCQFVLEAVTLFSLSDVLSWDQFPCAELMEWFEHDEWNHPNLTTTRQKQKLYCKYLVNGLCLKGVVQVLFRFPTRYLALRWLALRYVTSRGIASLQMDLPCVALLRFSGTLFVRVITSPGLLVRHQLIF